jgi:DNA-binding transcriptional LysR family regulator
MEFRQLRYFVTLAEELHFGRAAAREHIVQSALSQQLQRLERELGVLLLDRTTHHVELTAAGSAFLIEARQILAHLERAAVAAHRAASSAPVLRVGVVDASYDSMPQILREVQQRYPELEIHQVEAGVPEQFRLLEDGRLDVGIGRASLAPPEVASELFRLDPMGVLVPESHPLAAAPGVPVARLAAEPLLLAEEQRAPEFNQFVIELCRSVGFVPRLYRELWKASEPRLTWSPRGAVRCVSQPPVWRRFRGSCGGSWSRRCRGIRGRCCGAPATLPSTSARSSPAPRRCRSGWAGWNRRARRSGDGRRRSVISCADELNSDWPFPLLPSRGLLARWAHTTGQSGRDSNRSRGSGAGIDHVASEDFRVVQLTPPGSDHSIIIGNRITWAAPGPFRVCISPWRSTRATLLVRAMSTNRRMGSYVKR